MSTSNNIEEKTYQNHHVIKGDRILFTSKFSFKEMYSILISNIVNKPTSNIYFLKKLFKNTTLDTTLRFFQYKIINNVFFLNKKLHFWYNKQSS